VHGSSVFRLGAFDEVGGYRQECEGWEDLDLLQRLGEAGRVFVLPEALYAVRFRSRSAHTGMPLDRFLRVSAAKDRVVRERFGASRSEDDRTVEALYEREATRLWSGGRPALLGELAARSVIRRSGRRVWPLVWAAWGRVSPGSLRLAVRLWIRTRDRAAARRLPHGQEVEWRFG
jgi:hypothetical protein